MPGAPDPLYVNAREVLLDALGAHRASLASSLQVIAHR